MKPDIQLGPMSANRPKAAIGGKWAKLSATDPKRPQAEPAAAYPFVTHLPFLSGCRISLSLARGHSQQAENFRILGSYLVQFDLYFVDQ